MFIKTKLEKIMRKLIFNSGKIALFCLIYFTKLSCTFSQNGQYRKIVGVPSYIQKYDKKSETERLKKNYNFIDATTYLPNGYVTDGSVDYTTFIQKAISSNRYVKMPNFPFAINDKGIEIQSNQIILFDNNSKLKLLPSRKSNYEIFKIKSKQNVKIFSPVIVGDRTTHIGNIGEWGMGISIVSSSNISIINPDISNCWGDGIYLGQSGNSNSSINISYGIIDNNRRNGISIISANGLNISHTIIANTIGTSPQAGLDFEPNSFNENLKSINIKNCYFFNNKSFGVMFNTSKFVNNDKLIDISMTNVLTNYSPVGVGYSSDKKVFDSQKKIKGSISIENVSVSNTRIPFKVFKRALSDETNINIKTNSGDFSNSSDNRVKISK